MTLFIAVLSYVFYSIGMEAISRRRGIAHPWLSWVPFVSCFQLGCIVDHYRLIRIGNRGIMRWVLLVLGIINAVVIGAIILLIFLLFMKATMGVFSFGLIFLEEEFVNAFENNADLLFMGIMCSPLICAPYWIVKLVAQYKLYKSCRPDLAPLFLILNILLPFVTPVLIMICKDRDDGMVPEYLY